ncbi:MAG: HNH endonuclease [Sphingomonadales bacterium]|nr:MAG: HNH endonuclease [Sphingomonadales bacterium]
MQVVERDERDMEEVGPARRIVARQRGDLRLHLRRRLGHDVERVSGAHWGECNITRNRDIRQAALMRSKGRCEYCDEPGFRTSSGRIYLETHHVIPLSEGGPDAVDNVIAVCPLDHRKAHYAYDALAIRVRMIEILKQSKMGASN